MWRLRLRYHYGEPPFLSRCRRKIESQLAAELKDEKEREEAAMRGWWGAQRQAAADLHSTMRLAAEGKLKLNNELQKVRRKRAFGLCRCLEAGAWRGVRGHRGALVSTAGVGVVGNPS